MTLPRPVRRALLTALALGVAAGRPAPAEDRPSVLLITLDTTRADALGCYGAAGNPTPHLDRLAARGVRFRHCFAPCPLTLPSHATILTGLYPPEHGLRDNSPRALPPGLPLVTEAFAAQGYATAAFLSAEPVARKWGLHRGFALYDDTTHRIGPLSPRERRGRETVDAARHWLDAILRQKRPFFLWVHLFDPHAPYRAPAPFARRFPQRPYLAEVAYADDCVGRLIATLEKAGRLDRTAIMVTADHGEALGEHGEQTHAHLVYASTLHVPLICFSPDRWRHGVEVKEAVSLADLAPTFYHLLDRKPPRISGVSLLPALRGAVAPPSRPLYAESLYDFLHFGWAPLYAVVLGGKHLIVADRQLRLHDLETDPRELDDLAPTAPDEVRRLRVRLARLRARFHRPAPAAGGALAAPPGYLQAPHAEPILKKDRAREGKRPAPMEAIGIIPAFERAKRLSFAGTIQGTEEALDVFQHLLARDPANPALRYWTGRAYRDLARRSERHPERAAAYLRQARDHFAGVLNRRPCHVGAQNLLFQCFLLLGDPRPVIAGARQVIAAGYEHQDTRFFLAEAYLALDPPDLVNADRENRQALERFPTNQRLRAQRRRIDAARRRRKPAQARQPAAGRDRKRRQP